MDPLSEQLAQMAIDSAADLNDAERKELHALLYDCDQEGHAQLVARSLSGTVVVTDLRTGDGYRWDPSLRLWVAFPRELLRAQILPALRVCLTQCQQALQHQPLTVDRICSTRQLARVQDDIMKASHSAGVLTLLKPKLYQPGWCDTLNTVPNELPIRGGMLLDLRTCQQRQRQPSDRFSWECPVGLPPTLGPDYMFPEVNRFMSSITGDDAEMVAFLQKFLGYCLTGEVSSRCFAVMIGAGANGKGTLLELMERILGNRAGIAPESAASTASTTTSSGSTSSTAETEATAPVAATAGQWLRTVDELIFFRSKGSRAAGHTTHLAALRGARVVLCSEGDQHCILNEALLKRIASGGTDTIVCRRAHASAETTFVPVCKPILLTNHLPRFTPTDRAVLDRMIIIPFPVRFVPHPTAADERPIDAQLVAGLRTEHLDQFFAWLVLGAWTWYQHPTFDEPAASRRAKEQMAAQQEAEAAEEEANRRGLRKRR